MKLAATDLKVSIECTVDCLVEQPGALTVSSQRVSSMLGEMPDEDITLHLMDNNVIEITCGRIETRLFSMSPDEFPPIRNFEGIEPLSFKQGQLKKLFQRSSFAICNDQAALQPHGAAFEIAGGKVTVVATDGRRMSLNRDSEAVPEEKEAKVIIPSKMIHELERLLTTTRRSRCYWTKARSPLYSTTSVWCQRSSREAFQTTTWSFRPSTKEIIVNTDRFMEAMRRTRTMTNEKFNSVRFSFGKGLLGLKVVTPEVGEYEEELPVEYDGEVVEIAFNPDFVLDVLRRVDSDQVVLVVKDAMSPGILKPCTDAPDDSYVNVIMPIRI